MEDLVEQLGGAGVVVLGIHKGGGMIFNRDGLVEPARQMIQDRDPMDFKWTDVQVIPSLRSHI